MVLKLLSYGVIFMILSSCANTDEISNVNSQKDSTKPAMASMRGLNNQMIDNRLESMIAEAQSIEAKITSLIAELGQLQKTISNTQQVEPKVEVELKNDTNGIPVLPEKMNVAPKPEVTATKPVVEQIPVADPLPELKNTEIKTPVPSGKGIVMVRHGIHNDKTRLVFDVEGSTEHKIDLDKDAGILTITFPQTSWSTGNSKTYSLNQLSGYEAKSSDDGTIIALAIKNTSNVKTSVMAKSGTKSARLVVDLIK